MNEAIKTYNSSQATTEKLICQELAKQITSCQALTENKVWHGAPVWFINGNPIVGYAVRKNDVQLLFWSGQSFNEPSLEIEGTFKAAQIRYTSVDEINSEDLQRWLEKAQKIQWDYKNIVKRRGVLERLV